jgi:hypothetical protein
MLSSLTWKQSQESLIYSSFKPLEAIRTNPSRAAVATNPLIPTWSFGACQSWTEEVASVPDVIKGEECADS